MVILNIPLPKECFECPCYHKSDCRVLRLQGKPYQAPDIFAHKRYKECPLKEIEKENKYGN
jgi:hypothetical protein